VRRFRYGVEDAGHERPAAVGLDDLHLKSLAGAESVGALGRHADHPATDQHRNPAISLDSQRTPTPGLKIVLTTRVQRAERSRHAAGLMQSHERVASTTLRVRHPRRPPVQSSEGAGSGDALRVRATSP